MDGRESKCHLNTRVFTNWLFLSSFSSANMGSSDVQSGSKELAASWPVNSPFWPTALRSRSVHHLLHFFCCNGGSCSLEQTLSWATKFSLSLNMQDLHHAAGRCSSRLTSPTIQKMEKTPKRFQRNGARSSPRLSFRGSPLSGGLHTQRVIPPA